MCRVATRRAAGEGVRGGCQAEKWLGAAELRADGTVGGSRTELEPEERRTGQGVLACGKWTVGNK